MSHVSPAQQRGNTKTHKWQLKQSPLETHSALPCTHSEMWGDLIKNRTLYMAVLVENGMVITLFAHPVAHSSRQPNLALNPCPQRWVLSFMSHVFLAQWKQQHNPTIGCNATCIQPSSRRERGSLSARRAVLVENKVVITLCGKSNNRKLKQPPPQTPYASSKTRSRECEDCEMNAQASWMCRRRPAPLACLLPASLLQTEGPHLIDRHLHSAPNGALARWYRSRQAPRSRDRGP